MVPWKQKEIRIIHYSLTDKEVSYVFIQSDLSRLIVSSIIFFSFLF
jgi:hypothetical protein